MLDVRTKELIAVAASVVAKCQPCLDYHISAARKAGASESDMKTAVNIARLVRKTSNEKMDHYSDEQLGQAPSEQLPSDFCRSEGKCCS